MQTSHKIFIIFFLVLTILFTLSGCVNNSQGSENDNGNSIPSYSHIKDDTDHTNNGNSDANNYRFDFNKTRFVLFAWDDLGMHCMDSDYATFSLLPPYNTLKAQLLLKSRSPRIVSEGITITYEALQKKDGTINTSSSDKSNFWQYVNKLFPGKSPQQGDVGLTENNLLLYTIEQLKAMKPGQFPSNAMTKKFANLKNNGLRSASDAFLTLAKLTVKSIDTMQRYPGEFSNRKKIQDNLTYLIDGSMGHYWAINQKLIRLGVEGGCCNAVKKYCKTPAEYPSGSGDNLLASLWSQTTRYTG